MKRRDRKECTAKGGVVKVKEKVPGILIKHDKVSLAFRL